MEASSANVTLSVQLSPINKKRPKKRNKKVVDEFQKLLDSQNKENKAPKKKKKSGAAKKRPREADQPRSGPAPKKRKKNVPFVDKAAPNVTQFSVRVSIPKHLDKKYAETKAVAVFMKFLAGS